MSDTTTGMLVTFEIIGGCKCCAPGPRETFVPDGWEERIAQSDAEMPERIRSLYAGMVSLRGLLASPHDVEPGKVRILGNERR